MQSIKNLDSKISIFTDNFSEFKRYFFKDEEENLKNF